AWPAQPAAVGQFKPCTNPGPTHQVLSQRVGEMCLRVVVGEDGVGVEQVEMQCGRKGDRCNLVELTDHLPRLVGLASVERSLGEEHHTVEALGEVEATRVLVKK